MKNDTTLAQLIEQWPDLKKRTEDETDPDKLIALVSDLEDFLLRLEARVATNDKERLRLEARIDFRAVRTGIKG
jgi:hypothetical protein